MRLSAPLLCGIGVVALLALRWTFVDTHDRTPALQHENTIEQPLDHAERTPPGAATRGGAPRHAGGLPARGARSAARSSSGPVTATTAQPVMAAAVSATGTTISPRSARGSVRRESAAASPTLETSRQPAAVAEPVPPAEEDRRPRPRGIGGSVLEKSGEPAAGVAVSLRARRVFTGASPPSAGADATTDGRGHFAFGEVADGDYEVFTAKSDRYERASALVRAGADAVVLIVEPISKRPLSVRGVVESASGGTVAGVKVEVIGQPSISTTTDAGGAYAVRVPPGGRVDQIALRFRRSGYRDLRWSMSDGVRTGDADVTANVRLDPDTAGVSVAGTVSSTNGSPVAQARVQLDSAARRRSYRAVTDEAGRFVLANVEAGADYRLWARPQSGFKDGVLENVVVDAAAEPLAIALTPIGRGTLTGRMVAPDGTALPGFTMYLTSAYGAGARSLAVTSDGQGRFVVGDLPEGPVALQTRTAPAISVSGLDVSASAANSDVTVVVDVGPHRFDGRLFNNDGTPAPGVRVSLEWSGSMGGVASRSSRDTITNADGTFTFTQLGAGVHVVSAALDGAGGVRVEHAIGPGAEPVHITLPARRGHQ